MGCISARDLSISWLLLKTQRLQIQREGRHLAAKAGSYKNSPSMLTKPSVLTLAKIYLLLCCFADTSLIYHFMEISSFLNSPQIINLTKCNRVVKSSFEPDWFLLCAVLKE